MSLCKCRSVTQNPQCEGFQWCSCFTKVGVKICIKIYFVWSSTVRCENDFIDALDVAILPRDQLWSHIFKALHHCSSVTATTLTQSQSFCLLSFFIFLTKARNSYFQVKYTNATYTTVYMLFRHKYSDQLRCVTPMAHGQNDNWTVWIYSMMYCKEKSKVLTYFSVLLYIYIYILNAVMTCFLFL